MIGRVTLQPTDLDGFIDESFFDARAFAKNIDRADLCARRTDRIRVENYAGRTGQISTRDLFYERRDVDVRRTRLRARSVVAIQTPRRFGQCLGSRHRRRDLCKILFYRSRVAFRIAGFIHRLFDLFEILAVEFVYYEFVGNFASARLSIVYDDRKPKRPFIAIETDKLTFRNVFKSEWNLAK